MDCQKIKQNDLHEKYLLGQLDSSDRSKIERHLQRCAACRAELLAQQQLLAGIRALGREEMKAEIRRQAQLYRTEKTGRDWGRLARIAAVLALFVMAPGLFVLYRNVSKMETETVQPPPKALDEPATPAYFHQEPNLPVRQTPSEKLPIESEFNDKSNRDALSPSDTPRKTQKRIQKQTGSKSEGKRPLPVFDSETLKESEQSITSRVALSASDQEIANSREAPLNKKTKEETKEMELHSVRTEAVTESKPKIQYQFEMVPQSNLSEEPFSKMPQKPMFESRGAGRKLIYHYQKVLDLPAREPVLDENMQGLEKIAKFQAETKAWQFQSDQFTMAVKLEFIPDTQPKRARNKQNLFPKQFVVEVTARDSLHWQMIWRVDWRFSRIQPQHIRIELYQNTNITIFLQKGIRYRVDLNQDPTQAILMEPAMKKP